MTRGVKLQPGAVTLSVETSVVGCTSPRNIHKQWMQIQVVHLYTRLLHGCLGFEWNVSVLMQCQCYSSYLCRPEHDVFHWGESHKQGLREQGTGATKPEPPELSELVGRKLEVRTPPIQLPRAPRSPIPDNHRRSWIWDKVAKWCYSTRLLALKNWYI